LKPEYEKGADGNDRIYHHQQVPLWRKTNMNYGNLPIWELHPDFVVSENN